MIILQTDDTRTRVIKSTILLFNQYGPMVPMSQISDMAGVAAGTPFKHFKTKEELLLKAYFYARKSAFKVVKGDPRLEPTTETMLKTIMRGIINWAALMPDEHEYVEKYEDSVCYNYFSPAFKKLYEGIVEELDIWDRIKDDVRQDIPKEIISRIISVQCSVFIRYMSYHNMQIDDENTKALIEASTDSIWRSIARV
jgi:AcrR family transcriptional regulator